ncbi:universal stress protein [Waterburya agarophytonicola K14]|uniref:Universal stress protein n=1 Tax=Waterburya agarophytonicola KI4 TaxID=2874699 RepID=A0A964BS38_9CYAN|nr:universal stress protein [Waterburya agarophytonicola]MCC0177182.1 universal stress protein [Waterburya agarophytonicola KI4]
MLNKILVAIDITDEDKTIYNRALSLAQITGGKLMLLNIISSDKDNYPNPFIYSGYEYDLMDESLVTIYQQQWEKFKQKGLDTLRSLTEEAKTAGVEAEYSQDFGNPGHNICKTADDWSADLILIGSRGLTGVKEMFLGSVSNYVTHHAPCSVLIVRESNNLSPDLPQQEQQKSASPIS